MAGLPRSSGPLTLRRLRPDDLDAFLAYRSDPEVARYQNWGKMDRDRTLGFLSEMETAPLLRPGTWTQIGVAGDDGLIGDIGVHISSDQTEAEVGITLARDAQNRRFGRTAYTAACVWVLADTPVTRILGVTDARNHACQRMLAAAGMARSGTLSEGDVTEYIYEMPRL